VDHGLRAVTRRQPVRKAADVFAELLVAPFVTRIAKDEAMLGR
jgi:hypothetical protein